MAILLAASPLALILGTMLGLGWSAARAGAAGLALTLLVAILGFGLGERVLPEMGGTLASAYALGEAAFTAATILWIIFPALCIYELQKKQGAFDVIRDALVAVSGEKRVLVLLVAWFFALFMEGAAGFGTPVALAAPLLVSLGFAPVKAVVLALIGHAAGVSFGAVGTPIVAQANLVGVPAQDIAAVTGVMHLLAGFVLVLFLMRAADDGRLVARDLALAALAGFCFLVPMAAIAWFVGPELPTLAGAVVGAAAFVMVIRRLGAGGGGGKVSPRAILRAALPYLVIVALIIATRLIAPLAEFLREWRVTPPLPEPFTGSFEPLYHPGTMLLVGFFAGGLLQGRGPGDLARAAGLAAKRLAPVLLALFAMLAISRLMVHAQMIDALAEGAAQAGGLWPLLAAGIGATGTFVTGSATASNILLSEFQVATAQSLGLSVVTMLAAQSFGAAVGNIACPHNIIAGGATVGLQGSEGAVMQQTVLVAALYAALGGVITLLFVL